MVLHRTSLHGTALSLCKVLHRTSVHGTALCQFAPYCTWLFAPYCTVPVCTVLHCVSLHGTAPCQFVRYSVLQRHYINSPYTGFHPQRDKCLYQSTHALKQSMSATVPIFMKLAFTAQLFVKSCCTEFCENRTTGQSPTLQHRQTDGRTDGRTDIVITWGVIYFF